MMARTTRTAPPVDLILETSSVLFLCGAAFVVISLVTQNSHTHGGGVVSPTALIVATALPAAASLLLLIAAILAPGIYAVGKLAFPLNFTLPILHGSMVYMLAELTRGSFGLEQPPANLLPALLWDNLGFLCICVVFQIILLTAITIFRRDASTSSSMTDVER